MNNPKELTIAELTSNDQYVIPIYQRNYAWGESEIEQLIQDIFDSYNSTEKKNYYLGSLIVFQRDNDEFETIDGQQRQTTLSILLSVFKNEFKLKKDSININLNFDSRRKSELTLKALYSGKKLDNFETAIDSAYKDANRVLSNLLNGTNINEFFEYFLKYVKILRVIVPKDTDLNHYFEIMNNRGEQLEKHEILKARLMNTIPDKNEQVTFAKIWEACSQMNRYAQYGITDTDERKIIFGKNLNELKNSFNEVHNNIQNQEKAAATITEETLDEILKKPYTVNKDISKVKEESERFYSPINFSNFLLHVLKIQLKQDVHLDDKQLLDEFTKYKVDAKEFAYNLLKSRFLFDKYILKREWDDKWSLKSIKIYDKNKINYVKTFSDEINTNIIMILSMFHVSFPTLIYKHWLNGVMNYLYNNYNNINSKNYLNFLENFNDKIFYGRFGNERKEYFDLIYEDKNIPMVFDLKYLDQSTNISNFIFNRLDYLIWKEAMNTSNIRWIKCKEITNIQTFSFSFRSSVEHYYPQNPIDHEKLISNRLLNDVDNFANLCLISRTQNSKLSNYSPTAKIEHYSKSTTIESLKQQIMMSYKGQWGNDDIDNMIEHETEMIQILCSIYKT